MAWVVFEFARPFLGPLSTLLASLVTASKGMLCIALAWTLGRRVVGAFARDDGVAARDARGERNGAAAGGSLERSLIEIATGLGILSLAIFALAVAGLLQAGSVIALLASTVFLRPDRLAREVHARWQARRGRTGSSLSALVLGALFAQTLALSLTPETSQDALVYHLAVPARYIEAGGFVHLPESFFASFPQNVDLLFAIGLLLDGDALAKWFHWFLSAGAAAAVIALCRRLLLAAQGGALGSSHATHARSTSRSAREARRHALLAGLVFASIPTCALISTWAYVDLGVVFFSLVSWLAFLRAMDAGRCGARAGDVASPRFGMLVVSAWIAGVAAGTKYTGAAQALFTGLVLLVIAWRARVPYARATAWVALYGGVSFLGLLPWLVKNAWLTGNPLFPFAHALFPSADWDLQRAAMLSHSLREWGGLRSGWELLSLPWDLTFEGRFFSQEGFDGVIGAVFLAATPVVVFRARSSPAFAWTLALAALHAALWVLTTHQVRFLLPALALGAALIVAGVSTLPLARLSRGILGLACGLNLLVFLLHFATRNPLPVLCGLESRDAFLARELPGGDYEVFRKLNEELPEDARVLFGSCGNPGFLCRRPYHSDALFENRTLAEILRGASGADEVRRRFRERRFTHLLFRFANVFDPAGRRSELPLRSQHVLAEFLNRWGELVSEENGTRLYALLDVPRALAEDAG